MVLQECVVISGRTTALAELPEKATNSTMSGEKTDD
jgi:hypothetical protein